MNLIHNKHCKNIIEMTNFVKSYNSDYWKLLNIINFVKYYQHL